MFLNRFSSRSIKLSVNVLYKIRSSNYCKEFQIDSSPLNPGRLNFYKKAFYAFLFTGVVSVAWFSKKRSEKRSELIREATRLNSKIGRMTMYRFRDFIIPEEVLKLIPQLSSFPKTGVTWLQEIVWLIMNDYDFNKALNINLEERSPFLEWIMPGISGINKMPSPRLIKTHLPLSILFNQETKIEPKVISITRNPKDVVVSYYFFARMNKLIDYNDSVSEFAERFLSGEVPYGPLHKHYIDCLKYSLVEGNKVLLISYEDLHEDFEKNVHRICNFLDQPLPDDKTMSRLKEHCNFRFMAVNPQVNYSHWDRIGLRNPDESQFFRNGQVGDWTNHLIEPIAIKMDKHIQLHLSDLFKFKDKITKSQST
ncbi:sulfotransferase 1E1-like isoform X2 [Panonychus citri]|uniref:sulfotransferase 1E1-like isoform X2 n=1 Tax=Panonychus citri TaxID=50023 RepID=UPI0023078670|nr:sulfotransferase 1E1-like isoform X2 [Panonychus citri]